MKRLALASFAVLLAASWVLLAGRPAPAPAVNKVRLNGHTFTLPNDLPNGSYDLAIVALDADHYYQPLALADQGRRSDGSYVIGSFGVGQ